MPYTGSDLWAIAAYSEFLVSPIVWNPSGRLHADNVVAGTAREYGHADLKATRFGGHVDKLFAIAAYSEFLVSPIVWNPSGKLQSLSPWDIHTVMARLPTVCTPTTLSPVPPANMVTLT
jgi:hypothetical protein